MTADREGLPQPVDLSGEHRDQLPELAEHPAVNTEGTLHCANCGHQLGVRVAPSAQLRQACHEFVEFAAENTKALIDTLTEVSARLRHNAQAIRSEREGQQ